LKALVYVPMAMAAALALVAAAVFGLGDARTLVPPPEAVVENFVRELETERYEQATNYLSGELQSGVKPEQLRAWTSQLLGRTGDVLDVRGEPGWLAGERAEAYARLKTERAGEPALRFTLSREEGVWKVNGLTSLKDAEFHDQVKN
jgi:hypothetical protein